MAMTNGARPRIVALLNQKGGVGKTTTTANLGHALAIAGQRTCLIDLDPQGHLTLHLGIEPDQVSRTVYDLMVDPECPVADCIIREARPNLDVMLAEVDLAAVETELADQPHRRTILRDRFAAVADRYDLVLIDCPPSLGLLTVNALTMADELFVPMQAHFLALQGVGRLLETVRLVCSSVNADLKVAGVVLCMFERQTTLAKEILADLEGFFDSHRGSDAPWADCRVLHPPIRRNIKLAEAPSFGNTIFDYEPWCAGAIDYRRLAASLLERWGAAAPNVGSDVAGADESDESEEEAPGSSAADWTMSLGPQTPPSSAPAAPSAPASAPRVPAAADGMPAPRPEPPLVEIDLSGRSSRVTDDEPGSTVAAEGDGGRPSA